MLRKDPGIFLIRLRESRADQKIKLAYLTYELEQQLNGGRLTANNVVTRRIKSRRSVIKKLLEEPEKLSAVVKSCAGEDQYGVDDIWKLSENDYILFFTCYFGAYQGGGVLFLFSDIDGISHEPLQLKELNIHTSLPGVPIEEVEANSEGGIIDGYFNFDEDDRELFYTFRSGGQWVSYHTSKYSFDGRQAVLQETISGVRDINYVNSLTRSFETKRYIRGRNGWFLAETKMCEHYIMTNVRSFDDC